MNTSLHYAIPVLLSPASMSLLLITLLASYTDLQTRTIRNKITGTGILVGLILSMMNSLSATSFKPLILSLLGLLVCMIVGIAMVKLRIWAAGDSKLLMACGTILTFNPFLMLYYFQIIFIGAVWYLLYKYIKRTKDVPMAPAFPLAYLSLQIYFFIFL